MLKFEFTQGEEFDDPQYNIIDPDDNEFLGYIYFADVGWYFCSARKWGMPSCRLIEVAEKIEQLNEATQSQRILGVF